MNEFLSHPRVSTFNNVWSYSSVAVRHLPYLRGGVLVNEVLSHLRVSTFNNVWSYSSVAVRHLPYLRGGVHRFAAATFVTKVTTLLSYGGNPVGTSAGRVRRFLRPVRSAFAPCPGFFLPRPQCSCALSGGLCSRGCRGLRPRAVLPSLPRGLAVGWRRCWVGCVRGVGGAQGPGCLRNVYFCEKAWSSHPP